MDRLLVQLSEGELREMIREALREELEDFEPSQPPEAERHHTPGEVAELLRCSRRHVYDLIRGGRIGAIRVGDPERGRLLIPGSELARLRAEVGR